MSASMSRTRPSVIADSAVARFDRRQRLSFAARGAGNHDRFGMNRIALLLDLHSQGCGTAPAATDSGSWIVHTGGVLSPFFLLV